LIASIKVIKMNWLFFYMWGFLNKARSTAAQWIWPFFNAKM
jgi:hypothetical protein